LNLDDFYYDADHPDLPRTLGIVDWDDPATWNGTAAVRAMEELLETGAAEVPRYDISRSAAVGSHRLLLGESDCFIAEGIFAIEAARLCRESGITTESLYLDRPRALVVILRFVRDVREHRKSLSVLLRRGLALLKAEPQLRRRALAAGFRPVSVEQALAVIG
jgi:uridine kinase